MAETTRGRPSKFSKKVARDILARLAIGESLRRICSADDMPAESTVRGWVIDDVQGFSAQYARARDMGVDALADETIDIADDGRNDTYTDYDAEGNAVEKTDFDHIQRSKLRVSARQWYLSKVAPKKYGDKVNHELAGKDGGEIVVRLARPDELSPEDLEASGCGD